MSTPAQLRRDALQIWRAGVDAVLPQRLVPQWLRVEGQSLLIGNDAIPLDAIRRIAVVGGGKAGAGMAAAVEAALGPKLMAEKQLAGWVNVPADVFASVSGGADIPVCRENGGTLGRQECLPHRDEKWPLTLQRIHLHAARPAGVNEPTPEGVADAMEILRMVASLGPDDLCLCLISGGGSALMPAPVEGITLADKLAVTRHLSAGGANIEQLNTVRKQLSRIKGGGLLRACRAGRIVSLIISDVLGDPLDVIASGPTVHDASTPQAALEVLERFGVRAAGIAPAAIAYLEKAVNSRTASKGTVPFSLTRKLGQSPDRGPLAPGYSSAPSSCSDGRALHSRATNIILANNATAVAAASKEAERLGYSVASESAEHSEGQAEEVGRDLAERALAMRAGAGPACFISGGEPVVKLVEPSRRGLGGRNQQLVLAALLRLFDDGAEGIALLSGGTDGEDGPTDAAGALLDADVLAAAHRMNLDPADYLARNDAYRFFEPLDALIKTGPTQTNVCDVRVVIALEVERNSFRSKRE